MEVAIYEAVAIGRELISPIPLGIFVALGLFLATGTAARLLAIIEDFAPTRRSS